MVSTIVKLMRMASLLICMIVIVSFGLFVIDQTHTASVHQTQELAGEASSSSTSAHEGTVHKAIDEASERLTSPFAGLVSGTSSEWASRGGKLLLALAVYGFGLGFLARVLRVRG